MFSIRQIVTATIVLLLVNLAHGQVSDAPDPLFQSNAPLRVVMSGPFTTLVKERSVDRIFNPGIPQFWQVPTGLKAVGSGN